MRQHFLRWGGLGLVVGSLALASCALLPEALAAWQEALALAEASAARYWQWRILQDLLPLQKQLGLVVSEQARQAQTLVQFLALPANQFLFNRL